jgi:hypothetical protein
MILLYHRGTVPKNALRNVKSFLWMKMFILKQSGRTEWVVGVDKRNKRKSDIPIEESLWYEILWILLKSF